MSRKSAKATSADISKIIVVCVLLTVISIAAFGRSLQNGFTNIDDPAYITENRHIQNGLTPDGIRWAFTSTANANWHPLTWLSHMKDVTIFGLNPWGHHFTSLLQHTLSAVILFLAFYFMTGALLPSILVALLFAAHPTRAESVCWAAERKDVISGIFWMLTILLYARWTKSPTRVRYFLVVTSFILGLLSKPMLVTLPFVLLALDWWPLERTGIGIRKLVLEKAPLFVLAIISSGITFWAQKSGGAVQQLELYPVGVRLANAVVSTVSYIGKLFWPVNLSPWYPHPEDSLPVLVTALCVCLIFLLTGLSLYLGRHRRYLLTGWFWFVITLIPVIGIVQVGRQGMADRYTYIPFIGLFTIIAFGLFDTLRAFSRDEKTAARWMTALSSAAVAILCALSFQQAGIWKDGESLFRAAVERTGGHHHPRHFLGDALLGKGKAAEAAEQFREALKRNPDFGEARVGLGLSLARLGNSAEALAQFRKALEVLPDNSIALNNIGMLLLTQGKQAEALEYFDRAIRAAPESPQAYINKANLLLQTGKNDEAETLLRKAHAAAPDSPEPLVGLAVVEAGKGNQLEAIKLLQKAVEINPNIPEARYSLGALQMQRSDFNNAISNLKEAIRLKPRWPEAELAVAWAYLGNGDKQKAREHLLLARKHGIKDDGGLGQHLAR